MEAMKKFGFLMERSRLIQLRDADSCFFDTSYDHYGPWNAFDSEKEPDINKTYEVLVGKWSNVDDNESQKTAVTCKTELAYVDEFGDWRFAESCEKVEFVEKINKYTFFTKVLCWKDYYGVPYSDWLGAQVYKKNRLYEQEEEKKIEAKDS